MKKVLWICFIVLVIFGIYLEIADFSDWMLDYDVQELSNSWYFLYYLIPILFLACLLARYFHYQYRWLFLSLIAGGFIAAQLAVYGNEGLDNFYGLFLNNFKDWSDALTAPFVEEILKAACAFLIFYLSGNRKIQNLFLCAIASGLGFQIIEDFGYLLQVEASEINNTIIDRLLGALTSHWMYTAIFSVGIYGVISKQIKRYQAIIFIVAPLVLHFLWNSPLNNDVLSFVLSIITIIIFLLVTIKMIRVNKIDLNNNSTI